MKALAGLKALVAEDEGSIALLIEDMLLDFGCEIAASAARLAVACKLAQTVSCDFAVLDVNLAGQSALPVALLLRERGIPFVFSTGYGATGVPGEMADHPVLGKPFTREQLRQAILSALS